MADTDGALITKVSPWAVPETVARLRAVIAARGLDVVAVVDMGAEARDAGFASHATVLVIVGDSATITPIVTAAPLSAFDLPPRVLVWADALETKVTYLAPRAYVTRYHIGVELAATIGCITDVVDVVIDR